PPLFFGSGSMAPTIDTGALALAREVPADGLRVGDVVSVTTATGARVTHRIVRVEPAGAGTGKPSGQVVLTLRGDANKVADAEQYTVSEADRVFWHVPRAGHTVAAVFSPAGLTVLGLAVLGLLLLARRPGDPPGRRRPAHRSRRGHRGSRAGTTVLAAMTVIVVHAGPASAAPWTDDVVVTGTSFTSGTLVAPTVSCSGGGLLLSPTISWPTPSGPAPASYVVSYDNGSTVQTTTTTGNSWQLPSALLSVLATYTITVKAVLGSWQSPSSNTARISITSVLFVGLVAGCV
ncbi:MAG TPA: hypothetical protein VGE14_01535, partial [Marmoricola sp.]